MDGAIQEVAAGLEEAAGRPAPNAGDGPLAAVWRLAGCEVALAGRPMSDGALRRAWRDRQGGGATPLVVAAPGPEGRLAVVGPRDPGTAPPRLVDPPAFVAAAAAVRERPAHETARLLETDLDRSAQAAAPGIVVGGLLTAYFLLVRLGALPVHRAERDELARAAAAAAPVRGWRQRLEALGYELRPAPDHGYVAVAGGEPLAVVHPYANTEQFSRVDEQGRLPEGALLAACQRAGTSWGMLATGDRLRLFQAATERGAASTRWLDVDAAAIREEHRYVLGLYAPLSLRRGGLLPRLLDAARSFGTGLRDRLDEQVRRTALPAIANGLGRWLRDHEGADLMDPDVRREIQDATYTLLFRLLFVLYAESAGSLPYATSAAYRRNALRTLCDDARELLPQADEAGTALWDRWRTLVNAIKLGNRAMGVPAYNGSLFAPDALPGAALLERAALSDADFAAVLVAVGFDGTAADGAPGLDYAGLDIGHLGGIYEGLLALKLSVADQPYRWDTKAKRFVPGTAPGSPTVATGELFLQPEAGGRKGAGVYYTRQEFVRHLVRGAVLPALEEHLAQVRALAAQDPEAAARLLFRCRVLDPAMGSGHFLVDALAVIADRVQMFLAETPLPPVKERLAALRAKSGAGIEEVEDGRLLLRLLLKHCIYGVDLSAMAVELARVSLWLASFVPGLALSYLDHNLQQGDALAGVASFKVLTVPTKKGTRAIPMWASPGGALYRVLERASELALRLADLPDRTPNEVAESEALQAELAAISAGARRALDLWAAEPFGLRGARAALMNAEAILEGKETSDEAALVARAEELARRRHVFHWPLAFPEVFHPASERNPGFDAVVGNPPWDEVTVEELGFYALHDPGLRGLPSEAERRRRIAALVARYPALQAEYEARREEVTAQRRFFRPENGYELQGAGDLDLYELFCERYQTLTRASGYIGVVLPRPSLLGKGSRGFRRWLFSRCTLSRVDILQNKRKWAFPIHEQNPTIALLAARITPPPKGASLVVTGPSTSPDEFNRNAVSPGVRIPLDALAQWTHRRPATAQASRPGKSP